MGGKALLYFEIVTTLALVIGLVVANVAAARRGPAARPRRAQPISPPRPKAGWEIALHALPVEPHQARRRGRHPPRGRLRDALRRSRSRASATRGKPVLALLRRRGAGDVQVHRHGHAAHAARRVRRHGLQRQPHGRGARARRRRCAGWPAVLDPPRAVRARSWGASTSRSSASSSLVFVPVHARSARIRVRGFFAGHPRPGARPRSPRRPARPRCRSCSRRW